jgi:hypothetical protein
MYYNALQNDASRTAEASLEAQISLRLPQWLYELLQRDAAANERSVSAQVRYICIQHYREQGELPQGEEAES